MTKIHLADPKNSDSRIYRSLRDFTARVNAMPPGTCPIAVQYAQLCTAMAQTCGKCVPCRDGLPQLANVLATVLYGTADEGAITEIEKLATTIRDTSDCAIGWQAAADILAGLEIFEDEYEKHIKEHKCTESTEQKIPCVHLCPAHVNVPGYIALVRAGDYAGAINLIRKDNPFPTACAMVCEHPCETRCRRQLLDDAINIRALKKYAVDQIAADQVPVPEVGVSTGKKIAIIGGGPAGLTCAYFLALMGHKSTVFERQDQLGGMLRYGIPNYRFPKERLDEDIRAILSTGNIEVRCGVSVGRDISPAQLRKEYDALFIAIGAQMGRDLDVEGADAKNVESGIAALERIAKGEIPDYRGEAVAVIGGGNVAIDIARTAVRCGASEVRIVYRRRIDDMTAQLCEIEGAMMEGVELMPLQRPLSIEKDDAGNCAALITQPQRIGPYDRSGRPSHMDANKEPVRIPCSHIFMAIGQDIESEPFEAFGIPAKRNVLQSGLDTAIEDMPGVFVGGDCATSPATVIRAIAAGKVAANRIDEYLGYHHQLNCDIDIPPAQTNQRSRIGRANITERPAFERKTNFEHIECQLTHEEAMQEADRCLRCDHFGCGVLESAQE